MSCWFKHKWLECGSRKLKQEGKFEETRDIIVSVERCNKCKDKRGFIHRYYTFGDKHCGFKEIDFEYAEGLIDGTVKFID